MSIKPSASREINSLIAALSADDEVKRESAVARLAIIGERAMDHLVAAYPVTDRETQIGILRAAEAIADPRAIPISVNALAAGGDLAVAASWTLRALLDSPVTTAAAQALDALIATALDRSAERHVRFAAYDALQEMPATVRNPVAEVLRGDADPGVRARAAGGGAATIEAAWQDVIEGKLPDDPSAVREAVKTRGATTPLSTLQGLIDAVRAREAATPSAARKDAWRNVRGAVHQALAIRGSRIAVYDLREAFADAAAPLPASFLAALHVVGDESCLEAIAAAWTAAGDAEARGWRRQLEGAFQAISSREKISRRSATWKRVAKRFPDAGQAFSTTSRTRPRPKTRGRT